MIRVVMRRIKSKCIEFMESLPELVLNPLYSKSRERLLGKLIVVSIK